MLALKRTSLILNTPPMSLRLLWTVALVATTFTSALGQYPGWQQAVSYDMQATLDTASHQYQAWPSHYKNNSPETLDKVFWHLFFNAFNRKHDGRPLTHHRRPRPPGGRIVELPEDEWGWIHMERVKALVKTLNSKKTALSRGEPPEGASPWKSVTFSWLGRPKCPDKSVGPVG